MNDSMTGQEHPRILLTRDATQGLRTIQDLERAIAKPGVTQDLWAQILAQATDALESEPIHVHTPLPGRSAADLEKGNREYIVVNATGQRVLSSALAALLTDDERHVTAAVEQIDCLLNPDAWPEWQDIFHRQKLGLDADLRTGQLARDVGLAYDWLYPLLSPNQRSRIVEGLDARAIQPYFSAVNAGAWWVERMNNWTTVIVGGLGICGMALGADHPQSQQLIDMATGSMRGYLDHYGPDGEFNENPAYGNSSFLPVLYFHALGYHEKQPGVSPEIKTLQRHCIWCMYATTPPGHLVSFGDGGPKYPALTSFFPAVAAATQDPTLQWFYTTYGTQDPQFPIWEMLWYDDKLVSQPPTVDSHPLGRAFPAHSGLISSRSSWDPHTTPSVVFSKAGTAKVNHTHPDGGQVEIHGHGRPLIVDLGSVNYPDSEPRCYYHFSSEGHNQLTCGGRPQLWDLEHEATCTASAFDNDRGGWWQIDLTDLHEQVSNLRRTVVHLLPNIIVVVDEANLDRADDIRLRWHPGAVPSVGPAGDFRVSVEDVTLSGLVVQLDVDHPSALVVGQHEYVPPYDQDRIGNPMPQRHEPYLDSHIHGQSVRFLSLFAIGDVGHTIADWHKTGPGSFSIDSDDLTAAVEVTAQSLHVSGPSGRWDVELT